MFLTWSDNLFLKKVLYFLDDPELVEICRRHTFIRGFIAHLRLLLQKCVHILCFEIERRGNGQQNLISMISFCIFVCDKWGFRSGFYARFISSILLTSSKNQIYEFRIPNIYNYFFNNIQLMYTLCFLVASVKLKVYKKVVKFSFKQQEILGIRNS